MGMMTKMRDNAHMFIIAFAVVFIAFWVFSDLDVRSAFQSSQSEIGSIDGKSINYQEFQALIDRMVEERRKQNNGQEVDENTISSIREQVWNDYITQAVLARAATEFNIVVTDQEITDWVSGDAPPELLARYFRDSTGRFNRDTYEQFIRNPGAENIPALIEIEKQLKDDLLRQKITNVLAAGVQINDQDLRTKFADQSLQLAANYILLEPHVFAAKDTAAPSDDEYQAYYEKNKKQFKTKEMRKLRYVLFQEVPSAEDSASVSTELTAIIDEVNKGKDFLELIKKNSEQPYQDQFVSRGAMNPAVADKVFDAPVGSIVGPLPNETGFSLFKVLEERTGTEALTQASHILLRTDGGQNEAEQKQKAENLLKEAKAGVSFSDLAAKNSEEPGAGERGGSLGWFGKGRMVKEFEDACLTAKVGSVVGPIKTMYGWHVIKITGRSMREVKLGEIRMSVKPSSRTTNEIREKANAFVYFSGETSFDEYAAQKKIRIEETPEFAQQSGSYIPNIGVNQAMMKWAFENEVGAKSEVYRATNGYVVAMVSGTRPEGYKPVEDVKEQIRGQVVLERQMKKTLEYARSIAQPGKALADIAASNPALSVQFTNMFTPASGPAAVGRDDAMIGTLLRLEQGKISKPFRGMRGIFIVELVNKSPFDENAYKVKRESLRQETVQQVQNEFIQSWLDEQKEKIKIVDNRDRFYR